METQAKNSANSVLEALLTDLPERSRDVIVSRFGIGKDERETLESIGKRYGITRERVRQIEADALKNIRSKRGSVSNLLASLENFIRGRGGVVNESDLVVEFAREHLSAEENGRRWSGLGQLLLTIGDQFKKAPTTETVQARWYLDQQSLNLQESVVGNVVSELKKRKEVVDENTLVSLASQSHPNLHKRVILNYLACTNVIAQNVFGQWGLTQWGEVTPRGVKDKAYLVIKQEGRPLHFREVAEFINRHGFSVRPALAQTVHNELIKDSRFILVGRGLYALAEWGYKEGTVKDVIERVLQKHGPMNKEEIVKTVLEERFVKPSTIILNLNGFSKNEDGKYTLV
jgi:hypothetical protein